jgi:predicted FMN-binding regulatory protein PaiB
VYLSEHCNDARIEEIHALVRQAPLGMVVTLGAKGLVASYRPYVLADQPNPSHLPND